MNSSYEKVAFFLIRFFLGAVFLAPIKFCRKFLWYKNVYLTLHIFNNID